MPASDNKGKKKTSRKRDAARAGRLSTGRVTLSDVAKVAGVSSMTVSRAINRPDSVKPQALEAVRAAIAETGYVPNMLAGGLASNRTKLIGAIVPTLTHMLFSGSIEAFNSRLSEEGYQVLLGVSGYKQADDNLVRTILSRCPDGVLLTGTCHSDEVRRQLLAQDIPIVEGWDLSRPPIDMAVGFSHAAVGRDVARFLIRRGYENPIVIGAQDERAILRRDAFLEEITACGLDAALSVDTQSPSTLEMGRESFARLAEQGLSRAAVFCNSDWLAHGVIIEALARGFRVPEDIAVVGFGNLDFAAYSSPSLTSVRIDRAAIGLHAANMCLARLKGEEVREKVIDVGFDIVERQSA